MENGDNAALTAAMFVRGEAVVGGMGLGHAPVASVRHRTVTGGMNGAILRAEKAIGERWERMVVARLDDGDRGWLCGAFLGVSTFTLGAMLGHL